MTSLGAGAEDPIARQLGFGRAPLARAGLGDVDLSASFNANLHGYISHLSTQGQAELQQYAGIDATNPRVQQGAASALSLIQHGFTPGNEQDEAALIHTIAGGLCLAGPVGAVIGAYVELLWQVGNALACPAAHFFEGLGFGAAGPACGEAPCQSTGNWTTQGVMSASALPDLSQAQGTFRALVIPALASYIAQASNCKASFPPSVVVDGCVAMWNTLHEGPPIDLYVPPLFSMATSEGQVFPHWDTTTQCDASGNCAQVQDPNVKYAFYPMLLLPFTLAQAQSSSPPEITPVDPPRIVTINGGALVPASAASAAAQRVVTLHFGGSTTTAPSTGTKVAIGAAVATGAVVTGSALVAWLRGETFSQLWGGAWKAVRR